MARYFKLSLTEIDRQTLEPNGGMEATCAFTVIDEDDNKEYYLSNFDPCHLEPAKQAIMQQIKEKL